MKINEKLMDEFDAVAEDGRRYRLQVYKEILDTGALHDPTATCLPGFKRVCTSDGMDCSRINDDTFEIVSLGLIVKRA